MPAPKNKRVADGEAKGVSIASAPAVSGARELRRPSQRPTMPPATTPPVSQDGAMIVDGVDEIPELLRGIGSRPPTSVPSNGPSPNSTEITPAKKRRVFGEEVVVNRKDPRRED